MYDIKQREYLTEKLDMVLDVGCGSTPVGEVNLDLNIGKSVHHQYDYDVRNYKNFLVGSATDLPYQDKTFDGVYSSHVLEHIPDPWKVIKEFKRVSRKYVIVVVPNNPAFKEHCTHFYSWSITSLENFMGLEFDKVHVFQRCRFFQLIQSKILKPFLNIALFKKPLTRFFSQILGVEIVAIGQV